MKRKYIVHVFVIVVLLLGGLMVSGQNSAYACKCVDSGSYEEALEKNDWVFDGVVVNNKVENSLLEMQNSVARVESTFQVNGSWKGELSESITVSSSPSSDSCGYDFEVGKRYAVFAIETDEGLVTTNCGYTSIITDNSDIFTELGPYKFEVNVPPAADLVDRNVIDPSSPDAIVKLTSEEEVKKRMQDQKVILTFVFVSIGILLIVGACVLILRNRRR